MTPSDFLRVGISIVTYNNAETIGPCLDSILRISGSAKIFIHDNASRDGTASLVAREYLSVHLSRGDSNLGFGPGHNMNLRRIQSEFSLILNPDTVISEQAVGACRDALVRDDAAASSCWIVDASGNLKSGTLPVLPTLATRARQEFFFDRLFGRPGDKKARRLKSASLEAPFEVEALPGAFILAKTDWLRKIDFFDPHYFLFGDDTDLCARLRKAGGRILFVPKAAVVHAGAHSTQGVKAAAT